MAPRARPTLAPRHGERFTVRVEQSTGQRRYVIVDEASGQHLYSFPDVRQAKIEADVLNETVLSDPEP